MLRFDNQLCRDREYIYYFYTPEHAPAEARLTSRSPADAKETLVELKRGTPFRAILLDARTRQPIAGATVLYGLAKEARYFIWREMDDFADGHHGLKRVRRAVTNDAGELAFG